MDKIQDIRETLDDFKRSWDDVFLSSDPYGDPFRPEIETRTLFYPTTNFLHLSEDQYEAVVRAAKEVEDDGFFLSVVELPTEGTWWCEFPTYKEYSSVRTTFQNSLHSRNSTWGVLIAADELAVVGGSRTFGRCLRECYPQWRQGLKMLVDEIGGTSWAEIYVNEI